MERGRPVRKGGAARPRAVCSETQRRKAQRIHFEIIRRCRRFSQIRASPETICVISGWIISHFCIAMSGLCVFPHTFYAAIFLFSVKFRVFRGYKCRVHATLSKPRNTRNFTDKTAPRPSKSGCGRSLLQVFAPLRSLFSVVIFFPLPQHSFSVSMPSRAASFSIFPAMCPTPMAQWCAGPALLHAFMNAFAPTLKR